MNIRKVRWYTLAAVLGLMVGAFAGPPPNIPEVIRDPSATNCPSPLAGCNVYGAYKDTIDPFCCSESAIDCQNYKVDEYYCAAGALRYQNFANSGYPIAGDTCGGGGVPGCHS
jgi:hypothetical protein